MKPRWTTLVLLLFVVLLGTAEAEGPQIGRWWADGRPIMVYAKSPDWRVVFTNWGTLPSPNVQGLDMTNLPDFDPRPPSPPPKPPPKKVNPVPTPTPTGCTSREYGGGSVLNEGVWHVEGVGKFLCRGGRWSVLETATQPTPTEEPPPPPPTPVPSPSEPFGFVGNLIPETVFPLRIFQGVLVAGISAGVGFLLWEDRRNRFSTPGAQAQASQAAGHQSDPASIAKLKQRRQRLTNQVSGQQQQAQHEQMYAQAEACIAAKQWQEAIELLSKLPAGFRQTTQLLVDTQVALAIQNAQQLFAGGEWAKAKEVLASLPHNLSIPEVDKLREEIATKEKEAQEKAEADAEAEKLGKTHYEVLGVAADASQDDINAIYRKLARDYHPDVSPKPKHIAEACFRRINEAHGIIGDGVKRKEYDAQLEKKSKLDARKAAFRQKHCAQP